MLPRSSLLRSRCAFIFLRFQFVVIGELFLHVSVVRVAPSFFEYNRPPAQLDSLCASAGRSFFCVGPSTKLHALGASMNVGLRSPPF